MITTGPQLLGVYATWIVASGAGIWVLARWFAHRRPHGSVIAIAGVLTLICVASVVYALAGTGGPPTSPWRALLAARGPPILLVSFLIWPFATCAAVARILTGVAVASRATRWLAFACGMVTSLICPFALLAAGCGLAGACV